MSTTRLTVIERIILLFGAWSAIILLIAHVSQNGGL
jgi:hypothetical protein